jgi:eukaryotic-like serine/threonine-protein kinase
VTPERYARVDRLLDAVGDLPASARAVRLARECADDPSLAVEVERLLALAARDDEFLTGTAIDAAADDLAAGDDPLVGRRLGHYEVRARLGGGMSDVYRAFDARLGRDVVLKLLPLALAGPEQRARLDREARTLSALNHPHIVSIHDVGEAEGRAFLVTEYVQGVTLRAMLAHGPMPPATAVSVARQMALALDASHRAGVLHRDVKPENVMVRPDGLVTVIDFGIARAASGGPSPARDALDTVAGMTLGTPGYMAPEQIRGGAVDERTDVFALGVVLHEMLAGERPFRGDTPADGLAATLTQEPASLASADPLLPDGLREVVGRALAKRPAERFASAREMGAALDAVDFSRPATRTVTSTPSRRSRMVVGALAVALVAAIASGLWLTARPSGAPALTDRDTLLLGPFVNSTGDDVFTVSLRRALAAQLEQSPFLALAGDDRVSTALRLMKQPPDAPLTAERAREVCLRSGLKAYAAGAIDATGRGYLVTVEAVAAESGAVIARSQAEAPSRDAVLEALRTAAADLRTRLGETLASVRQFDPPVDQVTTTSLEALRSYALGREAMLRGRAADAIALLTRAVTIDPDFAVAWAQLSAAYANVGNDPRSAETATQAYRRRDGVSERERLYITQHYHRFVDGDLDQSIASLVLARGVFPRDATTRVNLASHYLLIGRPGDAEIEARAAIELNPDNLTAYNNAVAALVGLGRIADARATLDAAVRRGLLAPGPHAVANALTFIDGNAEPTLALPAAVAGTPGEADALNAAAAAAAVLGQWPRASLASRHAVDRAARIDATLAARFAFEASIRAAAFDRCDEARGLAAETTRLTTQAWFLSGAAMALALCGQADEAERLAVRILTMRPKDTLVALAGAPTVRALNALTRRQPDAALAALQHLAPYEGGLYAGHWPAWVRGRALLAAGRAAEAVSELSAVAAHRGQLLTGTFTPPLPLVELDLARAQAAAGDVPAAKATYARVLGAWATAPPDLPQLTRARTEQQRLR